MAAQSEKSGQRALKECTTSLATRQRPRPATKKVRVTIDSATIFSVSLGPLADDVRRDGQAPATQSTADSTAPTCVADAEDKKDRLRPVECFTKTSDELAQNHLVVEARDCFYSTDDPRDKNGERKNPRPPSCGYAARDGVADTARRTK